MNLKIIKEQAKEYPGGLKKLAADIGMTEANLHRCINKNRIQASDLESIALLLNTPVYVFFNSHEQQPPMNLGALRKAIDRSGLKKSEIIKSSGISKGTLDNLLRGLDVKLSTVESISKVLNVPIYDLFDEGNKSDTSDIETELRAQIDLLRSQIGDKERIIRLLERLLEKQS